MLCQIVRTIQHAWPDTTITWVIGKLEYSLLGDIPGIEFIVFDKSKGLGAQIELFRNLKHKSFDVLMLMQYSMRSHIASLSIKAKVRLGYDNARSKDLHRFFVNMQIPPANQHVMDSYFSFIEKLGISERKLVWDIPLSDEDNGYAANICKDRPVLLISPCSSHLTRSWNADGYAEVADYASDQYGVQVIITGSHKKEEINMAVKIQQKMKSPAINLAGMTTIKQLLALVSHSSVVLAPDSGPGHMATAMGIPVVGLYAATNPARARPYFSNKWCVNKYDEAAHKFLNKPSANLKWGTKLEYPGAMDLIQASEVKKKLGSLMRVNS